MEDLITLGKCEQDGVFLQGLGRLSCGSLDLDAGNSNEGCGNDEKDEEDKNKRQSGERR